MLKDIERDLRKGKRGRGRVEGGRKSGRERGRIDMEKVRYGRFEQPLVHEMWLA